MNKRVSALIVAATLSTALLPLQVLASQANAPLPFFATAHTILKDSIAMRTVEGYGQVPRLAEYLADKFRQGGFDEQDIHLLPQGETTALIVRFRGDGRSGKKPILLSAHMDVVEANPDDWQRNPYELTEEDGFYFGRGTSDNKFGVATLSTTLLRLKAEGFVPSRDIILALSGDEETAMATTMLMAGEYKHLIDAEFALVADGGGGLLDEAGQPISFTVDSAEKTYATYQVTARNPGGHSSLPRTDNAIYDLVQALANLRDHDFAVRYNDLTLAYFRHTAPLVDKAIGDAMLTFADNPQDPQALAVLRAHPEFGGSTGTTCVATMLKGGHAENALPQSASATINCRIFPGISVEDTLAELKQVTNNAALEWQVLDAPKASDASPMREDVFTAIANAVHAKYPGLPIIPHMASGASDALHFRAAGIPSYTFTGIFIKSSDEFAHGLNERVPVETLPFALGMWHSILTELAGD